MPYYKNYSKCLTKMPKIYFYDTGLACFLLGIKNEEMLKSHQMRGPLFENLAICEVFKRSYNEGQEPRLFFYREKSGLEVDAVSEEGGGLHLYEIKSGKTIRPEAYDNITPLTRPLSNVVSSPIIFDGESFPPLSVNIRDI